MEPQSENNAPIVKLCKLYALKLKYDTPFNDPSGHISNGLWETTSAGADERGRRWFGLTCKVAYTNKVAVGEKREMYESVILLLCDEVEIVRKDLSYCQELYFEERKRQNNETQFPSTITT